MLIITYRHKLFLVIRPPQVSLPFTDGFGGVNVSSSFDFILI